MSTLELRRQGLLNDSSLLEMLMLEDPAQMTLANAQDWAEYLATVEPSELTREQLAQLNAVLSVVDEATENPW